jgi:hypothetical protein
MHVPYDDILKRIPDTPKWWDNGVPRYDPFTPGAISIYATTAILARVKCARCDEQFLVGTTQRIPPQMSEDALARLITQIEDPPRHEGNKQNGDCSGCVMGWETLEILEAWNRQPGKRQWIRHPEFEGMVSS